MNSFESFIDHDGHISELQIVTEHDEDDKTIRVMIECWECGSEVAEFYPKKAD